MNHISYAWTTEALQAGAKEETRRHWTAAYAKRFHAGDIVVAIDKDFRYGGKRVGLVMISADPYPENTRDMPEEAYKREGLEWMAERGQLIRKQHPRAFFDAWRAAAEDVYVVRFEWVGTLEELKGILISCPQSMAVTQLPDGDNVTYDDIANRLRMLLDAPRVFAAMKLMNRLLMPVMEKLSK
jgi:hypothetical protein